MALLNIFKKEEPEKGKPKKKELPLKEEKKKEKPKEAPKKEIAKDRKKAGRAYLVLSAPHITEKATLLTEKDQYIFRVFPRANKPEVKKAIEDTYNVDVVSVRIVNIPRKARRLGRIRGFRKGYKKAIVRIKKGQKIEVLPR